MKLELIVPAATTIVALLIGAGINSYETRRLERQKFEFEVQKYTLTATSNPAVRLRLLCQFSEIGFIGSGLRSTCQGRHFQPSTSTRAAQDRHRPIQRRPRPLIVRERIFKVERETG
jgi:hypothetical protein